MIHETGAVEAASKFGPDRPGRFLTVVIKAMALYAGLAMLPGLPSHAASAASLEPWTAGPMPPFELNALGGGRIALDSQRGNITLVHFFATWCEPCRQELPALDRFAARHKPQGLRVLAIDVGEVELAVQHFLAPRPVAIPVLLDTGREVTKAWDISILPTTFLLDETLTPGRVAAGDVDWDGPAAGQLLDDFSSTRTRPTIHSGSEP